MPLLVPYSTPTPPPPTVTIQDPPRQLLFRDSGVSVAITTIEQATTQLGRSSPRTDGAATGTATITLDDTNRVLDPDNTSSPLYGHLTPGGTCTAQLMAYGSASWTVLFTGLIESIQTSWPGGTSRSEAVVTLSDASRDLNLHIPPASKVYPIQQSGTRITQMVGAQARSAWGWINRAPSGAFNIDAGQKDLAALTTDGTTSTWAYVSNAAAAEKGLIFFDQTGVLTFHDQMHRYRSSSPVWVFGDDPTAEVWVDPDLQYMLSNDRIVTDIAYTSGDGFTSGYGPGGAFQWQTDSTVQQSAQISGTDSGLADYYQTAARSRWEYEHYSINRRDAPTVTINALGEWPAATSTSRFNAAINAKISDYVRLNRRPGVGATLTKYYWIDAIAHNMSFGAWTTTFTLVAADAIPTYPQLGVTSIGSVTSQPW